VDQNAVAVCFDIGVTEELVKKLSLAGRQLGLQAQLGVFRNNAGKAEKK